MNINCPKCNSVYKKSVVDKTWHCSNPDCVLFYHKRKDPIDWSHVRYKIFHPDIKSLYYRIKNRLFKRYDLIRTGYSKYSWCDKDYLMLLGMMGLLEDYIEKEVLPGEYFDLSGWADYKDAAGVPIPEVILNLYIDWKVNYPKAVAEEEKALNDWSKSTKMICGDSENGFRSISFKAAHNFTEEQRKNLFEYHTKCEKATYDMEQDMLHRLIEIRSFLWT